MKEKNKPQQGEGGQCAPEKQTASIETLTKYENISAFETRTEKRKQHRKTTRNNVTKPSPGKAKGGLGATEKQLEQE